MAVVRMLGKFLVVMMAVLLAGMESSSAQKSLQGEESWGKRPVVVEIGRFAFVTREQGEYISNAIARASENDASAIVLRMDCPGGFACELRRFVESILKVKVPVIAWVEGAAAGAGAIAALSSEKVFFSANAVLGGEVEAIDWRGPAEHLPKRLTDLRYYDLADELVELLAPKGRAKQIVKGFCDPGEEVVLNGLKYSSAGDVLSLDAVMAEEIGIAGGLAEGLEELLKACDVSGEPVIVPALQTSILRERRGAKNSEAAPGGEAKAGRSQISDSVQEERRDGQGKLAFGQTRLESYQGKVVVIPVEMESLMRETKFEFMKRVIKKADDDQASAIIFDLNTPGGIAWYTEEIMLADLQKISIPTYSFVNPKAMSAGALIAIATDYIYMHPPSTIGAAAPVMGGGQDIPETMLKKVMSDLLSTADDVARRKGHNPEIAKAFIDTKVEVSFDLPFISAEGALESRDAFAPDTENDLLVLNSTQAVEIIDGKPLFAEGVANSIQDLISQEGLKGDVVGEGVGNSGVAPNLAAIARTGAVAQHTPLCAVDGANCVHHRQRRFVTGAEANFCFGHTNGRIFLQQHMSQMPPFATLLNEGQFGFAFDGLHSVDRRLNLDNRHACLCREGGAFVAPNPWITVVVCADTAVFYHHSHLPQHLFEKIGRMGLARIFGVKPDALNACFRLRMFDF